MTYINYLFVGQMVHVEGDLDLFTEVTQGHKWTQKWKSDLSAELNDFVETCFTQVNRITGHTCFYLARWFQYLGAPE